jgi:hypothetical protein
MGANPQKSFATAQHHVRRVTEKRCAFDQRRAAIRLGRGNFGAIE